MAAERLQKIIARAGLASRRGAEQLIAEGRVRVNGQVVDRLGAQADPDVDHIKVDGKRLPSLTGPRHYYIAYKPREVITSLSDPEGRPTVADMLKAARIRSRVYPVGRLDWDADGLLLLTDDGDLAQQVMHPKTHLPKRYRVKVKGRPKQADLVKLRRGIYIERGVRTLPAEVALEREGETASWVQVTLIEGRQNQIKKMFERIGHPVRRLRRLAIGPLSLGRMRQGEVRALEPRELDALRAALAGRSAKGPRKRATARPTGAKKAKKKRGRA